jgi:hypothetical protein
MVIEKTGISYQSAKDLLIKSGSVRSAIATFNLQNNQSK